MEGTDLLRVLLAFDVVGMLLLALGYLRRRRLAWHEYLGWSLVALLFPVMGPFLVIASRPRGKKQTGVRFQSSNGIKRNA